MCLVDQEKTFDSVSRRVVEWAMRKKGIPEALVGAEMCLCDGAKTKVKVQTYLSEEFDLNVMEHQGLVSSHFSKM